MVAARVSRRESDQATARDEIEGRVRELILCRIRIEPKGLSRQKVRLPLGQRRTMGEDGF